MIQEIRNNFIEAQEVLQRFMANDNNWTAMQQAGDIMVDALRSGHKILTCGNGGSMADAMHFAEELTGRFRDHRRSIPAIAISDPSHITCVSNDYGFDYIFSRYVEGVGNPGDILLGISTSGNSSNVLKAAEVALAKGMKVIALTGKSGGKLADTCSVELRVPHNGFSDRIQEIHIKIIHSFIQYIEMNLPD